MHPELSVVVPVYNEEEVLPLLVHRLRPVLDGLGTTYEVVTVDDGSTDDSAVILQRLRREWPEIRVIRLRANAGHQAAISAGLARARGDYTVTIDADLQDPPEVIAEMLSLAKSERVDVVYGVRNDRSTDTAFKRGTARAFYATMRAVSGTDAPPDAGDFRLMSRATVDAVNALPEHHRVLRLVVPALGFPSAQVTYRREERAAGHSKYPLTKMIKLSIDSLTSHSMAPLRLATWCGLFGGILAVLILVYALISVWSGHAVAGWASTVVTVAAVGAIQLLCLGLLGEYVGRMYTMMQGIPTYFVAYDSAEIRRDSRVRHDPADSGLVRVERRGGTGSSAVVVEEVADTPTDEPHDQGASAEHQAADDTNTRATRADDAPQAPEAVVLTAPAAPRIAETAVTLPAADAVPGNGGAHVAGDTIPEADGTEPEEPTTSVLPQMEPFAPSEYDRHTAPRTERIVTPALSAEDRMARRHG
ncbi:glycosyltransferase family 2 protein [Mobilicoccus massiliensis]|uniref:glycosyltransferase family 2 protein n=1 Tax=Mobilicoccus massiliensis TaxID=1522310 RepID=UPI0009E2C209|nr:glycosyltransferase [Mobilicoccus massiliensis]